jgi:lipopolysaccharide/colanic/teichoic acid biosynthesis glycosyltransferase
MRLFPVLIDSRPAYLSGSSESISLLLAPLGAGSILGYLDSCVATVSHSAPIVLSAFETDPAYEKAVRRACPRVGGVIPAASFGQHLASYEPSDWLLIADPRCFPAAGFDPKGLLDDTEHDPRWARHLVALEAMPGGSQECVEVDADGRVRKIQRYYGAVTWPFTAGLFCSLIPVASTMRSRSLSFGSLAELRAALAARGVPSRDVLLEGGAFDLGQERGLLGLNDRFVLELSNGNGSGGTNGDGNGHRSEGPVTRGVVHPSARVVGPVMIQEDAVVEEGATVLGPALLATGARVGRNAVVAQCVLGPGVQVPEDAMLRHRALFDGAADAVLAAANGAGQGSFASAHEMAALVELSDDDGLGAGRQSEPRFKVAADIIMSLAGLLVLSPLLLLIAALIKLTSRGPVFYGHEREGKDGRVFRCWKFRTMVADAEARQRELTVHNEVDGPQFKMRNDPRVTRIGQLLRVSNLDELPQLFNMLLCQMSLVGPRPSPFRENQMCIPWRRARLSVRPGITGLWQVCRHERSTGDFHQWIYYDLLYVRHMSLWVDVKIIFATLITLGGRKHVPLSWIVPPPVNQKRPSLFEAWG